MESQGHFDHPSAPSLSEGTVTLNSVHEETDNVQGVQLGAQLDSLTITVKPVILIWWPFLFF